jgi:hypothetical protein
MGNLGKGKVDTGWHKNSESYDVRLGTRAQNWKHYDTETKVRREKKAMNKKSVAKKMKVYDADRGVTRVFKPSMHQDKNDGKKVKLVHMYTR